MAADKSLENAIVVSVAPDHNKTDMGGDHAKLTPQESMQHVKKLIESLTKNTTDVFGSTMVKSFLGKEIPLRSINLLHRLRIGRQIKKRATETLRQHALYY